MGELETEEEKTRTEVAASLHQLAEQREESGPVTLEMGNRE